MPSKKTKTKKPQSKVKIVIYTVLGIVILLSIVIYGVLEIKKSAEIKKQQVTLKESLSDIERLYSQFIVKTKDYSLGQEKKPRNTCSEVSAVYVKTYTCGTRAEVNYLNSDEVSFKKLSETLRNSIDTSAFKVKNEHPITESSLYNGQNVSISLIHLRSGQVCYINGSYYREFEDYNDMAKMINYSFNCNLNSSYLIYPLED